MRLASHHCRPDIDQMLSEMTSRDLTRWRIWDRIEPLGREAKMFAILTKAMCGSKETKVEDIVSIIRSEFYGSPRIS